MSDPHNGHDGHDGHGGYDSRRRRRLCSLISIVITGVMLIVALTITLNVQNSHAQNTPSSSSIQERLAIQERITDLRLAAVSEWETRTGMAITEINSRLGALEHWMWAGGGAFSALTLISLWLQWSAYKRGS